MKKLQKTMICILMGFFWILMGPLSAERTNQSTTQIFRSVKVPKGEKKYGSSLFLKQATLQDVYKILKKYVNTGSLENTKFDLELFFNKPDTARKLVFLAKHGTVKTYYESGDTIPQSVFTIQNQAAGMKIHLDREISVEFKDTRLPELLKKLQDLTGIRFQIDPGLNLENIQVSMTLHKISIKEALQALTRLDGLVLKKVSDREYRVAREK